MQCILNLIQATYSLDNESALFSVFTSDSNYHSRITARVRDGARAVPNGQRRLRHNALEQHSRRHGQQEHV